MPSFTRGKKREDLVYVLVNQSMYYGWKRKDIAALGGISEADLTNIGHLKAEGATLTAGNVIVIGAKSPQPARVTRKISNATVGQQQSVSTFCAYDKLAAALGAKWNASTSRRAVTLRAPVATRGSLTAIATLGDGSKYCFPMNKADFENYGAELGLTNATTINTDLERNKLVSGSTRPYPGRASKLLEDGSTFSSFFSTAGQGAALTAGYAILSEEVIISNAAPSGGN
ncbi:hypothetical protein [Nostoc sp. PCC 7107]|uniref:hypothetical protein n=1 Tax=Nostoc sp. PCC 7107 TaxID=317936 RepID=UPI00029EE8C6|nr:hypothetical protein [Nostoc sp. PCC 7107]AFY43664.1 hypothetical protein Nos7107_3073 [Nostoc sp. PCC 7107]